MPDANLRHHLRHASSALHQQLDTSLGELTTKLDYSRYVQKTHCFRFALERALLSADSVDWQVDPISDLAAEDLADLEVTSLPHANVPVREWTRSSYLGALYVLEGSSLGARLLFRRAEALGMTMDFGARHLAHLAADHQRWRNFVEILETIPVEQHETALDGVLDVFRFALSIYREPAHECA
ncbi:biliverdin-producing heme oxygenase [Hoeflea sp. AS60]|uniref:biliverdin-producing heme oxygenase n=1 Tax=Hoeflea sp. AS60 TaxID=3135780 RepID=UPI00316CCFAD